MANIAETSVFDSGVYQLDVTDMVEGGANGVDNLPHKQLANRTQYLKERADQVDAAQGEYPTLGARLAAMAADIQAMGPEMQNMLGASILSALDQSGLALWGIRALREQWQQEGEVTILNRGVVSGCEVTKSSTAARNLNIAAGIPFASGRTFGVLEGLNAASVPSNSGAGAVTVSAYLYPLPGGNGYGMAVTTIGDAVPLTGIEIYRLTIPAGNTDATDPYLAGVTLTDVRRLEPLFPRALDNPQDAYIPVNPLRNNEFRVDIDVVSSSGAPCGRDSIVVVSRAGNGMTVRVATAADDIVARWRVSKLNQ